MSELKDYSILDIEAIDDERLEKSESGRIQETRVYIKSEADKVIAELKNYADEFNKDFELVDNQNERLLKIVRHNKYKRCLDKAEYCKVCSTYYFNVSEIEKDEDKVAEYSNISDWYDNWEERWLELAEKFKEAK